MEQLYFITFSWVIITCHTFVPTKCYLVGVRTVCRKFISYRFMWAIITLTFSIEGSIGMWACVSHSLQFLVGWRTIFTIFISLFRKTRYVSKRGCLFLLHHIFSCNYVRIHLEVKTRQTQLLLLVFCMMVVDRKTFFKLFWCLAHGKQKIFQLRLEGILSFLRNLKLSSLGRSQWYTDHATLLKCLLRWAPLSFFQRFVAVIFGSFSGQFTPIHLSDG